MRRPVVLQARLGAATRIARSERLAELDARVRVTLAEDVDGLSAIVAARLGSWR
jgi:hypothetical protein